MTNVKRNNEINIAIAQACGNPFEVRRFLSKIVEDQVTGCWEWIGSKGGSGYGQFWYRGKLIPAHWFLLHRHPSGIEEACHICDNKLCVNPRHIFIGTRSDNMRDCVSKGRYNQEASRKSCFKMLEKRRLHRGVNNHQCKLTQEQALLAKACPTRRGAAAFMAREFGVSLTVICDIRQGKRWTQLPPADATARQRAEAFLRTKGLWHD